MGIIETRKDCIPSCIDPVDRTPFGYEGQDKLKITNLLYMAVAYGQGICDRLSGIHGDDMCIGDHQVRGVPALSGRNRVGERPANGEETDHFQGGCHTR